MLGLTKVLSVFNVYHYITNIFKKRNTENRNESQDRFSTPKRAPSQVAKKEFKDGKVRGRRPSSNPKYLPSRLPKSFPLIRDPSEISLLGTANKGSPFKQTDVMRIRGSATNLHGAVNEAFDFNYPEQSGMNVRREGSFLDFQEIPSNKNSNSSFGYYSVTEDRSNDTLDFGESTTSRKSRLSNHLHSTPGISGNMNCYNLSKTGVARKFDSVPQYLPSRMPEACQLTRTPSRASLLSSNLNKCTPLRTKGMTRARGSNANLRNLENNSFDMNFSELGSINNKRGDLSQDFSHVPTHKDLKAAFEYNAASGDQINMQLNDASECNEVLTTRQLQLRNNSHAAPGYSLPCKHIYSKIPIRNLGRYISPKPSEFVPFSQRDRGRHNLTAKKRSSCGIQESENIMDTTGMKVSDICNWAAFRNDTNVKFELVFKSLSKKMRRSTGNIIDASSHAQWLMLAGITVDKDGSTFKKFAGGKVVLTVAEYKCLIHKISTAHDLDYWDVLRKMATFQEDLHY